MNAIVGLCHFCEAHGPRPLFCTFTTENEKHTTESSKASVQCTGCTSLGPETVFVSKDDDGIIYCSRESVPNVDVTSFLRQAAIRSITCEVSWSKEGGVVYFSDTHGHVLSYTFQLKDTRARGLKRWFSIVVLMKDKMLLLNITPLLSEHMQKISNELQKLADVVYEGEQRECSQRALRLRTGRNDFGQSRSLTQLTGDEDVFKRLHSQFTWILKAGAHTYSETLYTSQDLLKKLHPHGVDKSIFAPNACNMPNNEYVSLRCLETMLSKPVFRIVMFCTLTGIKIIIKSTEAEIIMNGLSRLLPIESHCHPRVEVNNNSSEPPSPYTCILEQTDSHNYCHQWSASLPVKCPTVMTRIEAAIINDKFNDAVLHQHVKSVALGWLEIARTLKSAIQASGAKSDAVVKLKQILGVAQHDDPLISYWISALCSDTEGDIAEEVNE